MSSSNKNSGQQTFTCDYDRYGNRWHQNAPQGGPATSYIFDSNNHLACCGVAYDAAGNMTNDGIGHTFTYDAEGRLSQLNGGSTTYVYDAAGRRVRGTDEFLYDLSGHAITWINTLPGTAGVWDLGEIYAGGRDLATYSFGTTNFRHGDWLGTKRAMSGVSGAVSQTCTGLPFADGVNCSAGNFLTYNAFTDDIHDQESNLEHTMFRQLTSVEGRWTTPDPFLGSMDITNPQSLNRYSYVLNNPLNYTDSTGLWCDGDGHGVCDPWAAHGGDSFFSGFDVFTLMSIPVKSWQVTGSLYFTPQLSSRLAFLAGDTVTGQWVTVGSGLDLLFNNGGDGGGGQAANNKLNQLLNKLSACPAARAMVTDLKQLQASEKLTVTDLGAADGSTSFTGAISIDSTYGITAHNLGHEWWHTVQRDAILFGGQVAGNINGGPLVGWAEGQLGWAGARLYNSVSSAFSGTYGFGPLDKEADAVSNQISSQCGID